MSTNRASSGYGRFLIRCDVSPTIGMGHLRRCLTLASELKRHGASVFFVGRAEGCNWTKEVSEVVDNWTDLDWSLSPESDAEQLIKLCRQQGIATAVIDHYRADAKYQQQILGSGIRWLQFDWSAREPLWADWVLNASPAAEQSTYSTLKQRPQTRFLLGPAYVLLRRQFRQYQPQVTFRKHVRNILLTFGGGDDKGATVFCLEAIKALEPSIERLVLVSSTNPRFCEITNWQSKNDSSNVTLLENDEQIARRMADADAAITAGGTTTFETAAMGLPSLIIQLADNQAANAGAWARVGTAIDLGSSSSLKPTTIEHQMVELINNPTLRESMGHTGRRLIDCLGAHRVAQTLLSE